MRTRTSFIPSLVTLLLAVGAPTLAQRTPARKPASKPALSATQVLEKAVVAAGGRAAQTRITSSVMEGTVSLPAQNLGGTFLVRAKAPNKLLVVQTIRGLGESKQGFDGKTGWSQDPFNGLRTLEGVERATLQRSAVFNAALLWRQLYKKAEMVGLRKVGSRSAYAVRLTPPQGRPTVNYYDAQNFLLLRADTLVEGPQGTVPTETYASDYRTIDGIKVPFATRQRVGGVAEVLLKVTSYKHNVPLEDSVFTKPAAGPR